MTQPTKDKLKIKLAYGCIETKEFKTTHKTFDTPYFDEWKETPISFEVTMEERALLNDFLYEFNGRAHPWQMVWKLDEHQGYHSSKESANK